MAIILRAVALLLGILPATKCFADYSYPFIQFICVKENNYFDISYKNVHMDAMELPKKSNNDAWQRQGLYFANDFTYECELQHNTYTVKVQNGSPCGMWSHNLLSLKKNDKPLIDQVSFGDTCSYADAIRNINIIDPTPGHSDGGFSIWIYVSAYDREMTWSQSSFAKELPIDKHWMFKNVGSKTKPPAKSCP